MTEDKHNKINRRNFLKTMSAAGLGSVFASTRSTKAANEPNAVGSEAPKEQPTKLPQVPRRKLGKTGVEIPCLSLGTNRLSEQSILRGAFQWGVTFWDTAHSYVGGNSELTIGKFIAGNPTVREKLFIVTKASKAKSAAEIEERLQTSLKRMNTRYIDLYYGVHGLSEPGRLTDELKQWVSSAKKRGLIRFFGFSTHKNMAQSLTAAARLDWIDAIMTTYNFRLMQDPEMNAAVDACYKAGIGLIAMKAVALNHKERRKAESGQKKGESEEDRKFLSHFLEKGFTEGQAKIKAVLSDKRISTACVGTSNIANLTSNVAAVLDKKPLTRADMAVFAEYAQVTCNDYCPGCAHICESAADNTPYISDIIRYLMYYNSYGDRDEARELFARIPRDIRRKLPQIDYTAAQARCPRSLPIAELVAEAMVKLA